MPVDPARVEAVFGEALTKVDAALRAAYLDQACGGDIALRERVEALLVAHNATANFLKLPDADPASRLSPVLSEGPGSTIGRYKLLEQIGEGGFGVVFMAEQTEPVQRKVALKIIKPGMDTRQVIARFEAERQALALMDHPHIAKVLDAGTTDSGRPYFVMELVKGVSIIQYCDDRRLAPRQRLELFATVCQAVQHAHQKGIIHRDLKPTNVLVADYDERPAAMVIDFGVAKAIGRPLTDKTMFTEFGQVIGTIEYMSPEQAKLNQLDIDTRTDIYSLGVLLYELLAGSTPFERKRLHCAAFDEMLRIIREDEFPNPSTRLSSSDSLPSIAANRSLEPRKLAGLMRGELDWIVMKALEKDRNRRYETATALAHDIERYLHDDPVLARPPSAGYRFSKFARRNKVALLTLALVTSALAVGTAVSTWQAIRATRAEGLAEARLTTEQSARREAEKARADEAEQRRAAESQREEARIQRAAAETNYQKARQAVDRYFTLVSESKLLDVPGLQPLRKELLEAALGYYSDLSVARPNDPAAQADVAASLLRLALVYRSLNRVDDSLKAIGQALDVIDRMPKDQAHSAQFEKELAGFWHGLREVGTSVAMPTESLNALHTLLRLERHWHGLAERHHGTPDFRNDLAAIQFQLGGLCHSLGRVSDAASWFRKSVETSEQLIGRYPEIVRYKGDLAATLQNWALSQDAAGDSQGARLHLYQAAEYGEAVLEIAPDNVQYQLDQSLCLRRIAEALRATHPTDSLQKAKRSLDLIQPIVRQFPSMPVYHYNFQESATCVVELSDLVGDTKTAEHTLRELARLEETVVANNATDHAARIDLAMIESKLAARLATSLERQQEAQDLSRRAVARMSDLKNEVSAAPWQLEDIVWRITRQPGIDAGMSQFVVEASLESVENAPRSPSMARALKELSDTHGMAHYRAGSFSEASRTFQESQRRFGMWFFAKDGYFLAMSHARLGQNEVAQRWYQAAEQWHSMYVRNNRRDVVRQLRNEAQATLGLEFHLLPTKHATVEEEQELVQRVLRANPQAHWIHRWLGECLANRGRWAQAASEFARAAELDDKDANAWSWLALARLKLGDLAGFQDVCGKIFVLTHSDDALSRFEIVRTVGYAANAVPDYQTAIATARALCTSNPDDIDYAIGLGILLYRAGRFEEAADQLAAAIHKPCPAIMPTERSYFRRLTHGNWMVLPRYYLAMSHARQNQIDESRLWLEDAKARTKAFSMSDLFWNDRVTIELVQGEADAILQCLP